MTTDDDAGLLRRGLDQLAGLLDDIPSGALGNPTPCPQWTLQDLVDHIVAAPLAIRFHGPWRGGRLVGDSLGRS
jgi:hypothetical protein